MFVAAGLDAGAGVAGATAGATAGPAAGGGTATGAVAGTVAGAAELEERAGDGNAGMTGTTGLETPGAASGAFGPEDEPELATASSYALVPALIRCEPMMLMMRADPKKMPAEYLVMAVRAVPEPAPKSASVAAPPNAMPAPASFLGT